MSLLAIAKVLGTFVFGSAASKDEQKVVLRRFKVALLRAIGAVSAAHEIEQDAELKRLVRHTKAKAQIRKQELVRARVEAALSRAIEIAEREQVRQEKKRLKLDATQRALLAAVKDENQRQAMIQKLNLDRDRNADDAAELLADLGAKLRLAGGEVKLSPEMLYALERYILPPGSERREPGQHEPPPS